MAKKQPPATKATSQPNFEKPANIPKSPEKNWVYWCFGVLALTFLVFMPSLKNGFVNWDDPDNLYENKNLEVFRSPADLTFANFKPIFDFQTGRVLGNFNPLSIATFAVEKAYFGTKITHPKTGKETENGFPFHLTNLLLHLLVVYFSFKLLVNMGISPIGAAVGAALMGIHPMRVESVAWVTERKDVLFGAFFFAALFYYSKWAKKAIEGSFSVALFVVLLILMGIGGFAKVQMVTLPLSMLAIDFWLKRPLTTRVFLEKTPFFALSLFFGYLNVVGLTESKSLDDGILGYSMLDRLAVGAWSYFTYLYKLIAPFPLAPLYPYPAKMPWFAFAAMLPVLAIAGWWFWAFIKNKAHALVFGIFFFTANVIFLLQIKAAGQGYLADRFTYVAYFGFFALAAWAFDQASEKESGKNLAKIMAVGAIGFYAILTINQQKIWKNGETLWSHVIKFEGKSSPTAWANRAQIYRDRGDFERALVDFNVVIDQITAKKPKSGDYNSRGKCYFDMAMSQKFPEKTGEFLQKAMADYNKGVELVADSQDNKAKGELFINRGAAHGAVNKFPEAIADITKGLEFDAKNENGYANRSLAFFNIREFQKAADDYTKYLEMDPLYAEMYYERGLCQMQLAKTDEAIADFTKAISVEKNQKGKSFGLYHLERARARASKGQISEAQSDMQTAQKVGVQPDADLLGRLK